MQRTPPKSLMRRGQVPGYIKEKYGLDVSTQRFEKLACTGHGPFYRLWGRFPYYAAADVDAWVEANLSPPVSSTAGARALQVAA